MPRGPRVIAHPRVRRANTPGAMLAAGVVGPMLVAGIIGCSSSPAPTPQAPAASSASPSPPPAAKTDARSRLQGTWELTTFISAGLIPDEAVPALALLHGAVRVRFAGDNVTTFIPGNPDEESCVFEISDENGDAFTLVTGLGMFRRAEGHFVSNDFWEATERGSMWPGTTRFQRVK
jgi:hypothetical protein